MSRPLVIGVGNPLRSDDGVGPRVADLIAVAVPDVVTMTVHQLTPELAEAVSRASVVVIVDASADDAPGQIRVRDLTRTISEAGSDPFSHVTDPRVLLTLADRVYGRSPPAVLVSVGAGGFDVGESLSPLVAAALPTVVATIRQAVELAPGRGDVT